MQSRRRLSHSMAASPCCMASRQGMTGRRSRISSRPTVAAPAQGLGAEAVVYIGDPSGDIPQREGPGFVLLAAGGYPLMLRGLCGRRKS